MSRIKKKMKTSKGGKSTQRSYLYWQAAVLQAVSIGSGVLSLGGGWL